MSDEIVEDPLPFPISQNEVPDNIRSENFVLEKRRLDSLEFKLSQEQEGNDPFVSDPVTNYSPRRNLMIMSLAKQVTCYP